MRIRSGTITSQDVALLDFIAADGSTLLSIEPSGAAAITLPAAGGGSSLAPTAVKTSGYTAVVNDIVPVDTTSGAVTVTLPTAPADKAQIAVRHIIQGSANAATITAGGSDVFDKASGPTSIKLSSAGQGVLLQYQPTGAIWHRLADVGAGTMSSYLTGNVTMVSANTFYTAVSLTPPVGTWQIDGKACVNIIASTSDAVTARLTDGTTPVDADEISITTGPSVPDLSVRCRAIVTTDGSKTYSLQVCTLHVNNVILATVRNNNTNLTNLATSLIALQSA